jgi:phenylacetaldehyde dehydrogenase
MQPNLDGHIPAISARAQSWLAGSAKKMLIDGKWVSALSGETFDTVDPGNGSVLARVSCGVSLDIDAAVNAARRAFDQGPWRRMPPAERAKILWRVADLMDAHIDELAELETLDQGKPLFMGRWAEIPLAAEQFRFFAGLCTKITGETPATSIAYQPAGKRVHAYTLKEPVGVVGAITPWNAPLVMHAMKLAPALAAGCTVVLKPPEDTPLTALRLGELMLEAGIPEGVVNIVTGEGSTAGDALARHPLVDKIAFTGSVATGKKIVEAARGNLKRVSLELGGKSPVIILKDADLAAAIPGAAMAIFTNSGQICTAGSRVYAHESIFDSVVEGISRLARSLKLGHGLLPDTAMGPLVSKRQYERVAGFVEASVGEGAHIVAGGKPASPDGLFFPPTVVTNTRPGMQIVREEVFGPVVVIDKFKDSPAVLHAANDSPFGLAASLWTQDLSEAHRLAADLQAGTVWVNCHNYWDPALPFGGYKQSGWGRESSALAVQNYLETKSVCMVI